MVAWKKWAVVISASVLSACSSAQYPEDPAALAAGPDDRCVPVSCFQLGRFCGTTPDGCGGTLDCGTCGNGGSCNEMGACCDASNPNDPCARPMHAAGDVDFAVVRSGLASEGFNAVDADLMGNIFAIRSTASSTLLESFTEESMSTNRPVFSVDVKASAAGVSVAPTLDRAYVTSVADIKNLAEGTTEMTFTKAGVQLGSAQSFAGESRRGFLSVGFVGNRAFVDGAQRLMVRDVNDRLMFEMEDIPFAVNDAAFDIDGNVYVVGRTTANFDWKDTSWNGNQPFMVKFTRAGDYVWARNINVPGEFNEVSVTPNGFAVVSGTYTAGFTFADTSMQARGGVSGMVLGFDPKGADRFAYNAGTVLGFPRVAMDQTGMAFIALDRPDCGAMEVAALTFKGELGWRKSFTNDGCTSTVRIAGLAAARGDAVIVGRFTGMIDGMNVEIDSASESHGFLIKLRGK